MPRTYLVGLTLFWCGCGWPSSSTGASGMAALTTASCRRPTGRSGRRRSPATSSATVATMRRSSSLAGRRCTCGSTRIPRRWRRGWSVSGVLRASPSRVCASSPRRRDAERTGLHRRSSPSTGLALTHSSRSGQAPQLGLSGVQTLVPSVLRLAFSQGTDSPDPIRRPTATRPSESRRS